MTEIEIKANFSKNIRDLRLSRKLNQIQLGEKIHYSSKAISKWENGDVLPDVVTLNMLANFFSVNVDDLISNKNVVRKSHRKLNRCLITISSCLLSFALAAVMFLILYSSNIPGAWKSFSVALTTASITYVVFSSIWYGRRILSLSVFILVWSASFMIMCFFDFNYYWMILIAAAILSLTCLAFFNIRFTNRKD